MAKKAKGDGKVDSTRQKWLDRIADEDKAHKIWRQRAKDADEAYLSYQENETLPKFPVFYTTIQLIHGRIYGHPPKPDIRKRNPSSPYQSQAQQPAPVPPQAGPAQPQAPGQPAPPMAQAANGASPQDVSKFTGLPANDLPAASTQPLVPPPDQVASNNILAMCMERCISYTIDTTAFDLDMSAAVLDYLKAGCGATKVEMETELEEIPVMVPFADPSQPGGIGVKPLLDEDGEPLKKQVIAEQEVSLRHFHWSQFRWGAAKDWKRVPWIAFDHIMDDDEIEDQFGVTMPEDSGSSVGSGTTAVRMPPTQMEKVENGHLVHEIWDKKKKKRLFVCEDYPEVLDEEDDPLELENFWPCPMPMFANVSGRELLPCPDYWQYEFLVKQCNETSDRLKNLIAQIKDVYFYDPSIGTQLKATVGEYPDGSFIPMKDMLSALRTMGGTGANTANVIVPIPMENKIQLFQVLQGALEWLKTRIYEINGIADIQRGVSNPDDTATAQTIKNEWADIRTGQKVKVVAMHARDVFRIMVEVIAKHFTRDQIQAMSGMELTDEQIATLRSDMATDYSIDVESDSTVVQNDQQDQQALTEFLQVFGQWLNSATQAIRFGALDADLYKEILSMISDTFKAGRNLEQAVDALPSTLQQLQQMSQQTQQLQQSNQQLQQKLQQFQQQEQMRKDTEAQASNQEKLARAGKTQAETALLTSPSEGVKQTAEASIANREDVLQGMTTGIQ